MPKVKLGDVATEYKGKFISSAGEIPAVGLEHLEPREMLLSDWTYDTENTFNKPFLPGQVLFGRRRAYQQKAAMAPCFGICSGDITVIKAKEDKIVPELLPFVIQNERLFNFAIKHSAGSLSPRVKWAALKEFEFKLPNIGRQKEITKVLWSLYNTRQAYKKLLEKTDELVKSQFIEMFGDPVLNNMEWPTEPMKKVAPETNADIPKDIEYWWLNLDMIESYSGRLLERIIEKADAIGNSTHTFNDSMVLYSKLRPYLNKLIVPDGYGYATTELVGLTPNQSVLNKYFLFNLLRGDCFVNYANKCSSGAQMPRMQMQVLREFLCILPPIELQNEFVEVSKQADKSKFIRINGRFILSMRWGELCD